MAHIRWSECTAREGMRLGADARVGTRRAARRAQRGSFAPGTTRVIGAARVPLIERDPQLHINRTPRRADMVVIAYAASE